MQAAAVQDVLVSRRLVTPRRPYGRPSMAVLATGRTTRPAAMVSGHSTAGCHRHSYLQGYGRNGRASCSAGVSRHWGHVRPPLVHDARHAAPTCAGRVHRDVYGAGVGRAISTGHVKSAGQWCEMLRATRSARASVIVWPDSSRAKKAPWFARCRPAVDRLIPRWAA